MKKFLSLFVAFAWTMIAFAATETTVYFSASEKWISGYTVKLNVQLDEGENVWGQYEMTLTTNTYNGDPVYVATYTDTYDGVGVMQFQLWEGTDWRGQDEVFTSWTAVSDYNGKMYVQGQGWTTAPIEEGGEGPEEPEDPTFTTVYFVNTPNWVNVHAYAWIDDRQHIVDWPGAEMDPTKQVVNDYVVYSYELDTRYGNILFNNGLEGENLQQTEDFVFSAKTPYYYYADNTWYATAEDITAGQGGEGGEGGETPEEDVYTVVGYGDIFGSDWGIEDNTNNMVKGDDGLYTLVKENVHLSIQKYDYKVVANHSWKGWQIPGYGEGNQSFTIETAGTYTVTFTLDVEKATLIANPVLITADENQEVPEPVYTVAGAADLMGSDWNLDDENNTMVKGQEEGIYTLTKENVYLDAARYPYKAVANHTWNGYQVPDQGNNMLVINVAGTYNVTFTLNTNQHTLIAEAELVKADEPVETFTGFIQPGIWDADGAKYAAWVWKADKNGQWTAFANAVDGAEENIYAIDVPAHIDSLIFVRFKPETETPSWETEIVGESEQYVWIWNRTGAYGTPKAENCRTFVITDWSEGLWCGQEEEEEQEEETSEFHVYLQGSWNGWSGLHECTLNADTTQATLTMDHLGAGTYEYQVVMTVGKEESHFANTGTMTRDNCTGWDFATDLGYGVNAGLEADMDGAYTFNLVIDKVARTVKVSVTYPDNGETPEEPTYANVYFVNYPDWKVVKIYAWNDDKEENAAWAGEDMTMVRSLVNGHAVYEYSLNTKFTHVIFNNGQEGENLRKTANLDFNAETPYYYNDTWYASQELIPTDEPVETFTGYIQPGIWEDGGAKYAAWVWRTGNDGQWTAFADAVDGAEEITYAIDVPARIDSLIFVRFKPETETPSWDMETTDEGAQYKWIWDRTGAYGTPKAENCRTFVITDWSEGLWCGQEEEEEETPEFHVYLQGSWNGWSGLHECTLNADTTQATLTMDHLGAGTYEYQVVVTVGKDEYHFANTGTMTRDNCTGWDFATDLGYGINAGLEADMDGAYTFNLVIDKVARTVKVSVTYPDNGETPEEDVYTVAGKDDLMGTEWNLDDKDNIMVKGEEEGIYTLTKENIHLDADRYEYKVFANHSWDGYQVPDKGNNELVIRVAGTYNVTFTLNTNEHSLTAEAELIKADPIETFTGFIQPGIWDADGAKYAAWVWKAGNDGQWTAFADAVDGAEENIYAIDVPAHIDSLIFVRFKPETETPSWETEIVGESEQYVWIWNRTGAYGTPKAENCRTFVITDWDKGLWCGQEEEEEEETPEFHVYLQGSWNDWSGLHEFKLNEDTTAATLTMERLGMGTYEYQIVVTVGKDEYHFANKGTMTRDNCTGWDFATDLGYGVNAGLEADMDGAYTFNLVIDKANRAINVSVTYPDNGEEPTYNSVYFVNVPDWKVVKIYAWNEAGQENAPWPGADMTMVRALVNGHAVYECSIDAKFTHVVFNNGQEGEDLQQTDNIDVNTENPYYYDGTWYAAQDEIPELELHVYLQGSWDNWAELHEFTLNMETFTATLDLQLEAETTYEFQIVVKFGEEIRFYDPGTMTRDNCTGWNFVVAGYEQNAKIAADMNGTYTFNITGNMATSEVSLSVTYPDNQGSALEETTVSSELRKVMQNGVLYIIRDGKRYNAQGAVVY